MLETRGEIEYTAYIGSRCDAHKGTRFCLFLLFVIYGMGSTAAARHAAGTAGRRACTMKALGKRFLSLFLTLSILVGTAAVPGFAEDAPAAAPGVKNVDPFP